MATAANPESPADSSKAISDYLLSKFFENIDQSKVAGLAKNMSPDSQFYVSKNLNNLRNRFAEFVKKFTEPSSAGHRVITKEDVCQFFDEINKERI